MKYRKHLVSAIGNDQLNAYSRYFAGHLTCSYNFRGYKRPRKLKTANFYPHVFEAKIWRRENIPFYGILNYFRHNGVFETDKTPNSRAQRHCDKCFTSYKRISKQKALLEKHKTGMQTGIRVENRGPTFC